MTEEQPIPKQVEEESGVKVKDQKPKFSKRTVIIAATTIAVLLFVALLIVSGVRKGLFVPATAQDGDKISVSQPQQRSIFMILTSITTTSIRTIPVVVAKVSLLLILLAGLAVAGYFIYRRVHEAEQIAPEPSKVATSSDEEAQAENAKNEPNVGLWVAVGVSILVTAVVLGVMVGVVVRQRRMPSDGNSEGVIESDKQSLPPIQLSPAEINRRDQLKEAFNRYRLVIRVGDLSENVGQVTVYKSDRKGGVAIPVPTRPTLLRLCERVNSRWGSGQDQYIIVPFSRTAIEKNGTLKVTDADQFDKDIYLKVMTVSEFGAISDTQFKLSWIKLIMGSKLLNTGYVQDSGAKKTTGV
jgi:hypothetical protein